MNCYANKLGNCSKKMSREHIISNGLLPNEIGITGFNWCKDKEVFIGRNSFTQKNLCRKHNEDLSPYDSEMKNLMDTMDKYNTQQPSSIIYTKEETEVINGEYIERWILKTGINLTQYYLEKEDISFKDDLVLPYLFGEKIFEYPYGLSIAYSSINKPDFQGKVHFSCNYTSISGMKYIDTIFIVFHGIPYVLFLESDTNKKNEMQLRAMNNGLIITANGNQFLWHIKGINVNNSKKKIIITWKNDSRN
jgi:hypothetical protein